MFPTLLPRSSHTNSFSFVRSFHFRFLLQLPREGSLRFYKNGERRFVGTVKERMSEPKIHILEHNRVKSTIICKKWCPRNYLRYRTWDIEFRGIREVSWVTLRNGHYPCVVHHNINNYFGLLYLIRRIVLSYLISGRFHLQDSSSTGTSNRVRLSPLVKLLSRKLRRHKWPKVNYSYRLSRVMHRLWVLFKRL